MVSISVRYLCILVGIKRSHLEIPALSMPKIFELLVISIMLVIRDETILLRYRLFYVTSIE